MDPQVNTSSFSSISYSKPLAGMQLIGYMEFCPDCNVKEVVIFDPHKRINVKMVGNSVSLELILKTKRIGEITFKPNEGKHFLCLDGSHEAGESKYTILASKDDHIHTKGRTKD
jgi:hypothetical protein